MGWASAGAIFDPVAQAMIDLNAPREMKLRVLGALIGALQDGDWDTEDESLEQFAGDPAIVEAFRQHGIILYCGAEYGRGEWCELELRHPGDHDWLLKKLNSWRVATSPAKVRASAAPGV
jgi:hypothetical protein